MKIIFCRDAQSVSDYLVEDFFNHHKDHEEIKINSYLLLYRFRVAVAKKEIEPFDLDVIDFNGKVYSGFCDEVGRLDENTMESVYRAKVVSQEDDFLNILIGIA